MPYCQNRYADKLNKLKKNKHYTKIWFIKLIAAVAKEYIKRDTKQQLGVKDYLNLYEQLFTEKITYIKARSIKRMMETPEIRAKIDNELIRLLTDANLAKERLPELYKKAEMYADEKKDGRLILQIAEKVEKANNLDQKADVKAHETREYESFAALKDNKPSKITQTLTEEDKTLKLVIKNNDENVPKQDINEEAGL
jgi:hypothetical protein